MTAVLREAGCDVTGGSDGILCRRTGRLTAPRPIRTAPYPGFPTDAQAILMAALLRCRGAAVFDENLFSSRYRHVDDWPAWGRHPGFRTDGGGAGRGAAPRSRRAVYGPAWRRGIVRSGSGSGGRDLRFGPLPTSTGAIRASRMIWRRWARIYGGWRRRPPPERQTVKENHHGKTERIGAAAQKGRQRLPL